MEPPKKSKRLRESLEIVALIILWALCVNYIPQIAGFAGGGFEKDAILQKFMFYSSSAALIAIVALKIIHIIKPEDQYRGAIIHDPEEGPSMFSFLSPGKIPRLFMNPVWFYIFCLLTFGTIGIFAVSQNTFFTGVPVIQQQFTPEADILFAVYPASTSETLAAIGLIAIFLFLLNYFTKGKLKGIAYLLVATIGSAAVSGIFGILNHLLRYGNSDIALQNVAYFWTFGGAITALTGSIIPFLVMHDINNLFVKLNEMFSSEVVFNWAAAILTFSWIAFIFLYFYLGSKKSAPTNQ